MPIPRSFGQRNVVLQTVFLIFLVGFQSKLVLAQAPSPRPAENDTLAIQEAGLRRLVDMTKHHPLGEVRTVCLLLREDGRWLGEGEVGRNQAGIARFLREEFEVRTRPRTGCVGAEAYQRGESFERPDRLLRDAETGEPAAQFRISEPDLTSPSQGKLSIGYSFGPLWGKQWACSLEKVEGRWLIKECRVTAVS